MIVETSYTYAVLIYKDDDLKGHLVFTEDKNGNAALLAGTCGFGGGVLVSISRADWQRGMDEIRQVVKEMFGIETDADWDCSDWDCWADIYYSLWRAGYKLEAICSNKSLPSDPDLDKLIKVYREQA